MVFIDGHENGGISHWTDEEAIVVSRIELDLKHRRRKSVFVHTITAQDIPDADIVVG